MATTAMELATAYISIVPSMQGSTKLIAKELGGAGPASEDAGRTAGQRFKAGLKRGASGLGKLLGAGVLAGGAVAAAAGAVGLKTAAEMETAQIAFETMLGSGKEAEKFLGRLQAFAAKTPFDLPGLQRSAQSLISIGIDTEKVIPIMTTLGNVTAGMGTGAEGVQRATVAIQQMNAAGKISAEDLNQLRDAGIPVFDLLTAATGKTTAEIADMASKGKLGRKEMEQLMTALESGKGLEKFNGMMEKQSASLSGIWSTLKDTFSVGLAEAIEPALPMIKDGLGGALTFLSDTALPAIKSGLEWLMTNGPIIWDNTTKAVKDAIAWWNESKDTIGLVAGVITAILLPALVRAGIAATVSAGKHAAAWLVKQGGAIKTGAVYIAQSYRIIGTWIAMGAAAIKSGAQTAAIWLMYRADAIKAAAVYVAQSARIAAAWVVQSTAAVVSGAKTKAVWLGTVVASAARGTAAFLVSVARTVGGWLLMGTQSLIHAARMAAAWFIALGPIGWVTAAVIAIAALVIANWDKIVAWTRKAWQWVVDVFNTTVGYIRGAFSAAFTWLRDSVVRPVFDWILNKVRGWWNLTKFVWQTAINFIRGAFSAAFTWLRDRVIKPVWDGITRTIDRVWSRGIKPIFDTIMRVIKEDVPNAFERGVGFIEDVWQGVQDVAKKPIKFVVDTVLNDGLIKAYNTVAGFLKIGTIDPIDVGFARGGVLPGYEARKRDTVLTPMRAGEGVLVPEVVRATGPGFIHSLNAAGNTGGPSAVARLMGQMGIHPGRALGGLIHPVPGATISSGYRTPARPDHDGIDYAAGLGTPIKAAGPGRVTYAGWGAGGAGNMVKILHGGGLETLYYHMQRVAADVGRRVSAGSLIGTVGSTGNSTGPHLHFTVRQNGRDVDPSGKVTGGGGGFNPFEGLINKLGDAFKDRFPQASRFAGMAWATGKKLIGSGLEWAKTRMAEIVDNVSDTASGVMGRANWSGVATNALIRTGHFSPGNLVALLNRMDQESSFNPNAINRWDSNAAAGIPSKGLMQVIDPTFQRYRDKSLVNDIFDPLANIVASINYTKQRYGNLQAGWNRPGGYALGGIVPALHDDGGWLEAHGRPQLLVNKTRKPEPVLAPDQWDTARDAIDLARAGGGFPSTVILRVGDREFTAYVDERADTRIDAVARRAGARRR